MTLYTDTGLKDSLKISNYTIYDNIVTHLSNSVEYIDIYDHESGSITIIDVIENGTLKHVINCLEIVDKFNDIGVFDYFKLSKIHLIETALFHDIGKVQPKLLIGHKYSPKEVFEDGKIHAARGARIALEKYNVNEEVCNYILFHHHKENELPKNKYTTNIRWLTNYRLFKIIDGLSAAITRRKANIVAAIEPNGILIKEINRNKKYNGTWKYNLHTGEKNKIQEKIDVEGVLL